MTAVLLAASVLALPPLSVQAASAASVSQASAPTYPPEFRVRKRSDGFYYATARGMTLYALNRRIAFTRSGGAESYCTGPCAKTWKEASAPAGAKPVADWTVIDGVAGPQWAYRGNPVFSYAADRAAGDTLGDGHEDLWNLIAHVPPPPSLTTPPGISPLFAHGRYVLADGEKRALFVARHKASCEPDCASWTPFLAGLSARDIGDWRVDRGGAKAHWTYRGVPVFVSPSDEPAAVPDGGQALSP